MESQFSNARVVHWQHGCTAKPPLTVTTCIFDPLAPRELFYVNKLTNQNPGCIQLWPIEFTPEQVGHNITWNVMGSIFSGADTAS